MGRMKTNAMRYACADRFCVSGLTVEREGDVCVECKPDYHRADLDGEDARGLDYARQGKEWNQMGGGL
jgi:hypothetical protein